MSAAPLLLLGPGWRTAAVALERAGLAVRGRDLRSAGPRQRLEEARALVQEAAADGDLRGVLYLATSDDADDAPSLEDALADIFYPGIGATQGCLQQERPLPVLHVMRADIVQGYACLPLRAAAELALVGALLCLWREAQARGWPLGVAVLAPPLAEALPDVALSLLEGRRGRLRFLVSEVARLP
jgi:hypothetical protein